MTGVIIIVVSIGVIIVSLVYPLCVCSSEFDDKILVIHNRHIIEGYSGNISCIIDKIQLLLGECPMTIDYIMSIYDQIVLINNRYICNKLFDISLIIKLLNIWGINRDKAIDQLVNFKDLDNEFKALSKIVDNISKKLCDE